jgi:hypothetical protein
MLCRYFQCRVEGSAGRHQRRRSHYAVLVRVGDGAVHTGGHAEIVGIHDESLHGTAYAAFWLPV